MARVTYKPVQYRQPAPKRVTAPPRPQLRERVPTGGRSLTQMPDRAVNNSANVNAWNWLQQQLNKMKQVNAQRAASPQPRYQPGVREQGNINLTRGNNLTRTQMPDRVVQPTPRPQTRVTYSTPIDVRAKSPTMLPDTYFNMQQRIAGSQGLTGNTLPDTLLGQANRVYGQFTEVPTIGQNSQGGYAGGYGGYDDYGGYGGYGRGYGGGSDWGGGGGGTYKEQPPEWYQIMTTWNYG